MSDGLIKLKGIGAQKIHEQTHIVRAHAQAVLHESFDDMTKIQFLGFISILQREYDVDLSDLKANGEEFYDELATKDTKTQIIYAAPQKKNSNLVFIIVLTLIFVVVAMMFIPDKDVNPATPISKTATTVEQNTTDSISNDIAKEDNNTVVLAEDVKIDEPKLELLESTKSFNITPKSRLWIGYMDLATRKKSQTIITDGFELNATKDWLLSLGHGYIDVFVDGVLTEFRVKNNVKLLYKDGNITKISFKEYKVINKGNKW